MKNNRSQYIYDELYALYPDAHCQLDYQNAYQLMIAVVLSAQTTDVSVNRVTPALFARYPDARALSQAELGDVEALIRQLGLFHMKAKNIVKLAQKVVEDFDGEVPQTMEELVRLPGVGRKCANVILSECYQIPALAVDTHVGRIAKRLKIAKDSDPVDTIETKMKKYFPKEQWRKVHHLFIFFGRNKCKARKPDCTDCPFADFCREQNKNFRN